MKKTARVLSLILVLALFAIMAIGSGSSSSSNDVKAPSSVSTGGQTTETTTSDTTESNTTSNSTAASDVTIEEAVVFDQGGIRITAKSFDAKGVFGPEIKLLIENDSDNSVTVQSRNTSVNGYMVETLFSADVASGKKANDSLTIMSSYLDIAGITTVAVIEFSFHIFDSETWETIYDSDPITIETSAAEGYTYSFDDSGNQVYNEDGVEIVVKGLSDSSSWLGPEIVVYISNTSDRGVTVQARDVSINGFMVEPFFSCDVAQGKHAIDTVTFMSTELEENEIETIESVELSFHVFDLDTWDTIVDTSPVTINFD